MARDNHKYSLPIEYLPEAFAYHQVITDDDGKPVDYIFLEVNPAFEEMTGLKRKEVVGKKVTEVLPGIEKGNFDWIGTYGQVAFSGKPARFESYSEPLGRWYEVSVYSDKPGFFGTIFYDITDTKKMEQELFESNNKYLSMFEQSSLGICLHDLEGNLVDVNHEACAQLGYTKAELLEMSVFDLHPQDENSVNMPKEEILEAWSKWQSGDQHVMEAQHQRKDGKVFPVQITTGIVKYNSTKMLLAMVQDVTSQKQAQEKLEQEKSEKELILSNLSEQVAFLDPEMHIMWANSIVIERHKLGNVEYKGKKCYEAYHQLSEPCPDCPIVDVFKTGLAESGVHRSPDGSYWQMTGTPVFDDDGKIVGVLDTALDISDLKAVEEELKVLNINLEKKVKERTAQLEALNKELVSFAYSVSHDLRTPLRAIEGFSARLNEKYIDQLDEQGQHYLNRIRNNTSNMSKLIDDLLKLSRVSRTEINLQEVNLSHLAEECINLLQETDPSRRIEVEIATGLSARGDQVLLRVILENLLDNAWKFSSQEAQAKIAVGRAIIGGEEVFYVRDNGVGFDMTYADKLFGTFQRLHAADEFRGTGIGLATVQRIINRHGGKIWAESEVDKGATFYFSLPV